MNTSPHITQLWRYALFAGFLACAGLPIYIFAPKLFVEEYGVNLATAGAVLLGLRLIDVVQDPFLGRLAARLEGSRAASVTIAGLGMMLGMLGLFAITPPIAPAVWMSLCLMLLFTSHSFLTILFYARGVSAARSIPGNGHVRLAGWRETGTLLGVCLASIAPFLFAQISSMPFTDFALAFCVLGLVAISVMNPVWRGEADLPNTSFLELLRDPQIGRLLIIAFVNALPVAVTSSLFLIFTEYRLEAEEMSGPLLLLFFAAAAVSALLWTRAAARFGPLAALLAGMALSVLAFGWAFMIGSGDVIAFAVISAASGAALGADLTLLPAIFAGRVAERQTSGAYAFGLWNFASKLTLAVAAATVLPLLEWGGFQAGSKNTPEALRQLSILYALVPCALKLLAISLLWAGFHRKPQPC